MNCMYVTIHKCNSAGSGQAASSPYSAHLSPACDVSACCKFWQRIQTVLLLLWRTVCHLRRPLLLLCVSHVLVPGTSPPLNFRNWSPSWPALGSSTCDRRLDFLLKLIFIYTFFSLIILGVQSRLPMSPSDYLHSKVCTFHHW